MRKHTFRNGSPARNVPRLETLEHRDCPARIAVFGHTLVVVGDAHANAVSITDDGHGGVSATIDGLSASGTAITKIRIATGAGDDTVKYALTAALAGSRKIEAQLGGGNDLATFDASAGVGSGCFRLELEGGDGNDTLAVAVGTIAAGASAALELEGGRGDDKIDFTGSGKLDGRLTFEIEGGRGNDTVTANVTIDVGSTGKLKAEVEGNSGDDTLTLNVIDNTFANGLTGLASLRASLCGGLGTDTLNSTTNVEVCRE